MSGPDLPPGPVRLLVLQWAADPDALREVEDELTPLARRHGAVVRRDAAGPLPGYGSGRRPPDEVHAVDFPDLASFRAFLDDPDREPLRARLAAALDHTDVWVLRGLDDATRALDAAG